MHDDRIQTDIPHRDYLVRCHFAVLAYLLCFLLAVDCLAAEPPFVLPKRSELLKLRSALIETDHGDILVELYPENAPWHVANLKYLADKGYYTNRRFHIVIPGFIVQGGASSRNGMDDLNYVLPPEFSDIKHEPGTVGMARKPDDINRERTSSPAQFHILLSEAPNMNGSYTVFGKVVSGMDVVERLERGDLIRGITVFVRDSSRQ